MEPEQPQEEKETPDEHEDDSHSPGTFFRPDPFLFDFEEGDAPAADGATDGDGSEEG
jgi:hypothetical protein